MANKFVNKILNFMGLEERVIEGEEIEENDLRNEGEYIEPIFQSKSKKSKLVNIHTSAYLKVVVYQPTSFDDTQNIINNLKSRKPVVITLELLDAGLAQRVLDFISGAIYALDGTIQKVSRGIFVLAPSNIEIVGNIPEELKGKSFFTLVNLKEKE